VRASLNGRSAYTKGAVRVRVAFLPRDLPPTAPHVCVVLDVLRASSTLVTLVAQGAEPVYLAASVAAARRLARRLPGPLLRCGEIGGLPPPDFDHGNSPTELARQPLRGRAVLLATTNGTRALAALATAPAVLVGCFLNATAAARQGHALARALGVDLAFVCAGDEGGTVFALEDALAAGCLVDRLLAVTDTVPAALDDAAVAAWQLFQAYSRGRAPTEAVAQGFADAQHGRELARLGFQADLAYCSQLDISAVVPALVRAGEVLLLRPSTPDTGS